MVSSGPRKKGFYPRQPSDLREGVTNAYIVLREVRYNNKLCEKLHDKKSCSFYMTLNLIISGSTVFDNSFYKEYIQVL